MPAGALSAGVASGTATRCRSARGARTRGRPLRRAQRGLKNAERVLRQPGQRVAHAGELRPEPGARGGTPGVPVPAGRPADRAPGAFRCLVWWRLRGRYVPDVTAGLPAAVERGPHPVRDVPADAARPGLHQPPLEVANRVAGLPGPAPVTTAAFATHTRKGTAVFVRGVTPTPRTPRLGSLPPSCGLARTLQASLVPRTASRASVSCLGYRSNAKGTRVARKWPTFTHSVRPIRTRRASGWCTWPKRA